MGINKYKYMEESDEAHSKEEYLEQLSKREAKAAMIAKEVEELFEENEKRSDSGRYLVNGAVLTCSKAILDSFLISDDLEISLKLSEKEQKKEEFKNERLYTKLCIEDCKMSTGEELHATVIDREKGTNILPFQCNCAQAIDRQAERELIYKVFKLNDGDKKTAYSQYGVCQYLMELEERWENMPKLESDFYDTRKVPVSSETKTGKKVRSLEEVPCITMTSMLFCKHGGLITPVESGQFWEEITEPTHLSITKVSDKLIEFIKNYETGKYPDGRPMSNGQPALQPYFDAVDVKTIGWGHAVPEQGRKRYATFSDGSILDLYVVETIDLWQAEELLAQDIRKVEYTINRKLQVGGIEHKVNQVFYDALADLLFQSGTHHINDTDLSGFLDEENFDLNDKTQIKLQFGEYTGGNIKENLKNEVKKRRADELDIIFYGDYTRDDQGDYNRHGDDIWGVLSALKGK